MNEKKLLILGFLLHHSMHGYQLAQALDMGPFSAIKMSKANAYKLLDQMAAQGWLTFDEEQSGNRPAKRVYKVTSDGKAAFESLLAASIAASTTSIHEWLVGFDFIHSLEPERACQAIDQRLEHVNARLAAFLELPAEQMQQHPSLSFLLQSAELEKQWLSEQRQKQANEVKK